MTCPGDVTTSPGHRPTPAWCRTAPARCLTAVRLPPSMCSRRGTSREPASHPISRPRRTRGAARRPIRSRARDRYLVPGPRPAPGLRRSREPVQRLSPAAVPLRTRAPAVRRIRTSRRHSPAGPCTTRPDQPAAGPRLARASRPGRLTPMTPVASPRPGQASVPPWEVSRETGPLSGPDGSAPGPDTAEPDGNVDIKGLPRRVRQASLAPQLRASPPQRRTTVASAGPGGGPTGSTRPSPAEIRQNHVSASARLAGRPLAADGRPDIG